MEKVANAVLEMEGCPYEVQLNVLLTDNDGIHAYNKEYRNIDRETDVLSFPNLDFAAPGDFDIPEDREADYFDPDTGELILGDIIISVDRVREQAESYGHSRKGNSHSSWLTACCICADMTTWSRKKQR